MTTLPEGSGGPTKVPPASEVSREFGGLSADRHLRAAALSGLFSAGGTLGALFLSGILNARALGPTDRGYFALVTLTVSVLAQLAALGTSLALTHYVASRMISAKDALRELRSVIVAQVVGCAAVVLLAGTWLNWDHPTQVRVAAVVTVGIVFTSFGRDYGLAVLQGCGRNTQGNLFRMLPGVLWTVGIGAIYAFDRGSLLGAVIAFLVADSIATSAVVIAARSAVYSDEQQGVEQRVARADMTSYGRRGFLGFLSPLENFSLDQFYVNLSSSATNLGYYATASAFTNIPRVIAVNLGMTASPIVAAAESRGASRRTAGVIFVALTMAVTVAFTIVLAVAISYLIPVLFGEAFRPAIHICQVLLVSGPIMAFRRILVDVLRGAGRPAGALAEVLGLVVFFVAAPLLEPVDGPAGVAWAFVIANACNVVLLLTQQRQFIARRGASAAGAPIDRSR